MDANDSHLDIRTRKILFLTNEESGQANTILALSLEACSRPHVEVHIASFPDLKRRVEKLSSKLNFHPLDGDNMFEVFSKRGVPEHELSHPPTTKSFVAYENIGLVLAVWEGECWFYFLADVDDI